ncbi:MAG: glycosyltransferase family 2 protein [Actinomycetota bacterium]|nr:glycosyltransferase family 2 protein [Actinomycetota bacterium]
MKKISIVTPCYNEEVNVEICARELKRVMDQQLPSYDYEHIFADNASTDSTLAKLREIAAQDKRIKVISNSRNVGPFRNMWNGMKSATGDAVVPQLAADLQDPPSVIPEFVKNWEAGFLVTYGVRAKREEPVIMRMARGIYYRIIKKFAAAVIPLNSGEFLLADKKVIDSILAVDDQYPYIRGLIAQTGVKSTSVSYTWVKRERGKSKNNFISLIDQAINGFVSTSRVPARLALLGGFILSFLGFAYAIFTLVMAFVSHGNSPVGIPTIIVGIFLLGGVQLLFLGLIGEYILSIHGQVRRTPPMFEVERINFKDENG